MSELDTCGCRTPGPHSRTDLVRLVGKRASGACLPIETHRETIRQSLLRNLAGSRLGSRNARGMSPRSRTASDRSLSSSAPAISEEDYLDCYRRALRRMAVTLNLQALRLSPAQLRCNDEQLLRALGDVRDKDLFRLRRVSMPDAESTDPDVAENFFYGWFEDLAPPPGKKRWRLIYCLPDAFLEYGYQGLHFPPYTLRDLDAEGIDPSTLIVDCATNYILKNFWHNFVHNVYQDIDHTNHHQFGGSAQFESDFDADNLGTVLLAYSYGLPIRADGFSELDKRFLTLLRRNRCNRVFAVRATRRPRGEGNSPASLPAFLEEEWRLRRAAANYVGGRLLASGRTVGTLGVYLTGRPVRVRDTYRRKDAKIVVQINGIRLATNYRGDRRAWQRASLRDYGSEVAQTVDMRYAELLRERPRLKEYAIAVLRFRLAVARL